MAIIINFNSTRLLFAYQIRCIVFSSNLYCRLWDRCVSLCRLSLAATCIY